MKSKATAKNHVASHCLPGSSFHVCWMTSELYTPGLPVYDTAAHGFLLSVFHLLFNWDLTFQPRWSQSLPWNKYFSFHPCRHVVWLLKRRPFAILGLKLDLVMQRKNSLKQVDGFHLHTVLVHGCALLCPFGRGRLAEIFATCFQFRVFFKSNPLASGC